ncbi:hypothetical protein ETB97_010200 [Aspergillus alliaceus]|uniref:Zn(2)-C6 fungal-type domain-containing protein n=1 Tax=Petromyces alliaceus TaxID=209559 RepID=A0A8H6E1A9_PETAA|nr:hypothetical protein ETB97_010200 [Aspergillus burnettii]
MRLPSIDDHLTITAFPTRQMHSVPDADKQWRHYPYNEVHGAEQTHTCTALPPLSSQEYPFMPNRELLLPPPDGLYGWQGSFPSPNHTPMEAQQPFRGSMNGTSHDPAPHSAPPEYQHRLSSPPKEPHSNGDTLPLLPPHLNLPAPYSIPVPPVSHTPAPYGSGYYQSQAYGMRQSKAAQAQQLKTCDQSQERKAKCDEGRLSCSHCKKNNLNCIYKEVPPHKQEKATQLVLDRLQTFQDTILDRFDHLDQLNTEHGNNFGALLAKIETRSAHKGPQKPGVPQLVKKISLDMLQDPKAKDENIAITQEQIQELTEATTEQVIPSGKDSKLLIPVEHTTAAHKLLLLPSIQNLLLPREYDKDYIMKLKEQRGLIYIYGCGEGDESSKDNILSAAPLSLSTSSDKHQPYYTAASPSGPWNMDTNQPQVELANKGLDKNSIFTADADTVHCYHKSFMTHIHQLHPFLHQADLENKIDKFIRIYCPQTGSIAPSRAPNEHANGLPRGGKRKRFCENLQGTGYDMQHPAEQGSGQCIEYSVHNAIILLVLALGSICEANPVPGPVTDYLVDFREGRIPGPVESDYVPHSQGSDYNLNNRSPTSTSLEGDRLSGVKERPRSQVNQNLKNIDIIPGLAFYPYATQILGSLQGTNGLPHVQAALLAGLYAGQLAHPFQSHGWIYQAARACQVLVRSKCYTTMPDSPVKDLYDFAYWTCLQLESDILAELDLPASGISRSEARISLPKEQFTLNLPNEISAPNTMMMFFYSAQIYLRKILNRVHTDLYKVESKK